MPLKPGDRIERYLIDAPLGQGGMGEVYRAHDERLQRSVALKILHVQPSADESASKPSSDGAVRMVREARAAAALDHPNVVAIYDVGQVADHEELRGTTYLAMELIKGRSLRTYVGDARVTMKERVSWLADIAHALAAAHAAGIVHRDVKPENVMIRDDGRVKVLDFGIAKRAGGDRVDPTSSTEGYVVSTTTSRGVVMGTPMYMAPEQLRAESLDGRADQFSWGVLAYELLTGKLPWSTEGGAITLVSQILSAVPPPFDPNAGIPASVADTVMRALSKDRAARFPTMEALLDVLTGPVSALAETAAFVPASHGKSLPFPSGSGPRVIVSQPVAVMPTPGELKAPAVSGRVPRRRRIWMMAAGSAIVVGAVATVAVVGREQAKRRAVLAAAASAKTAAAVVGCTSNRACAAEHGGEPYVCRGSDHTCVEIASEDCKPMYEPQDLASDDTVWLGAMFPTKGPIADLGNMNTDGVDFARTEIAQAIDSLDGSSIGRRVRRVALVACDDSDNAKRAALHLVDDVGVPAILGFRSGKEVIDLAGSLLIDRGVVTVATLTPNPMITRLPQPANEPRLVWRTIYGYEALAEATASFVHDALEPREAAGHRTRVILLRNASVSGVAFGDTFYRRLVFNGKPAVDNGRDYQEIVIDAKEGSSAEEAVRQIRQAAPTIVVDIAPPAIVEQIEADLPRTAARPIYVLVDSNTAPLATFIGASSERRHRVFAVSCIPKSTPLARFVIRYDQARHKNLTRDYNPSFSYDAFYLLAYASFALPGGTPVTGVALASRFSQLVGPGKSIEVGPTEVFDALTILSSGGTIDLEGIATGLDFDLSTGETPSDFALFCPAMDDRGRANGEDVESGVVYQQKTQRADGSLRCP